MSAGHDRKRWSGSGEGGRGAERSGERGIHRLERSAHMLWLGLGLGSGLETPRVYELPGYEKVRVRNVCYIWSTNS